MQVQITFALILKKLYNIHMKKLLLIAFLFPVSVFADCGIGEISQSVVITPEVPAVTHSVNHPAVTHIVHHPATYKCPTNDNAYSSSSHKDCSRLLYIGHEWKTRYADKVIDTPAYDETVIDTPAYDETVIDSPAVPAVTEMQCVSDPNYVPVVEPPVVEPPVVVPSPVITLSPNRFASSIFFCFLTGQCPCLGFTGEFYNSCIVQKYPNHIMCELKPIRTCAFMSPFQMCVPEPYQCQ